MALKFASLSKEINIEKYYLLLQNRYQILKNGNFCLKIKQ